MTEPKCAAEALKLSLDQFRFPYYSKTAPKGGEGGGVTVDGQNFPNISATAQVTGYTFEQLKEHLQSNEKGSTDVVAKKKAVKSLN